MVNWLLEHQYLKRCEKCKKLNLPFFVKPRKFFHPFIHSLITSEQHWCPTCDKGMRKLIKYEQAIQDAANDQTN